MHLSMQEHKTNPKLQSTSKRNHTMHLLKSPLSISVLSPQNINPHMHACNLCVFKHRSRPLLKY
uniref:Putative ovule protein n=1 Tax=Solanum chacoense TaxID=4108 RepID=A0A0V0GT31_SOLCH